LKLENHLYYETELGKQFFGNNLDLLPLVKEKADFGFADPPYGINKAEWDNEFSHFFINFFQNKVYGGEITCGDNNIAKCINELNEYKGIMHNFNKNGMTFNKVGFENVITGILFGKIKRGQNYIAFSIRQDKPNHPSPKPIEMMIKTIRRFTNKNDLVLDPFLGSGTTAVACEKLNRRWIGIEINEKYCEIAKQRIYAEVVQGKLKY